MNEGKEMLRAHNINTRRHGFDGKKTVDDFDYPKNNERELPVIVDTKRKNKNMESSSEVSIMEEERKTQLKIEAEKILKKELAAVMQKKVSEEKLLNALGKEPLNSEVFYMGTLAGAEILHDESMLEEIIKRKEAGEEELVPEKYTRWIVNKIGSADLDKLAFQAFVFNKVGRELKEVRKSIANNELGQRKPKDIKEKIRESELTERVMEYMSQVSKVPDEFCDMRKLKKNAHLSEFQKEEIVLYVHQEIDGTLFSDEPLEVPIHINGIKSGNEQPIKAGNVSSIIDKLPEGDSFHEAEEAPESHAEANLSEKNVEKHDEQWKNSFEAAGKEIKEISNEDLKAAKKNPAFREIFDGNIGNYFKSVVEHEGIDGVHVPEAVTWHFAKRTAEKINKGEIQVAYNKDKNKTYIIDHTDYEEEKAVPIKAEAVSGNSFESDEKKERGRKIEAMEEKLFKAINAIQEVSAVDFLKSTKFEKVFSNSDVKGPMEALLNGGTNKENSEKYFKDLEAWSGVAEKILNLEKDGKKCILLNGTTFVVDKKEEVSLKKLEKTLEGTIGKKYLEEITLSVSAEIGTILVGLKDNTQWKKLSRLKKEKQTQSGIEHLINKTLTKRKDEIKIEKEKQEEISEKLQRYIFSNVFEKQKI